MAQADGRIRVGVIGLGLMGSALADALKAEGFPVTVWNRTSARAERHVKAGATLASSVAEAARLTDALIVCLFNQDAVREVLLTPEVGRAQRGKPLVQFTSLGERGLNDLEAWASEHGVPFLKGDILDYPEGIRNGEAIVLYGGEHRTFDAIRPVLDALGGYPVHAAERVKDAGKTVGAYYCFLYPALVAFLHGAARARQAGMSPTAFAEDVILPLLRGPTLARMIGSLARASSARSYGGELQATLDAWTDGLRQVRIADLPLQNGLLPSVKTLLEEGVARGYGQQDLASVFEILIEEDEPYGALSGTAR